MNGNTITASVGAVATGAIGAISAGTTQATSGTVVFANTGGAGGVSFGLAGNTLTASIAAPVTSIQQSVSAFQWQAFQTNNTVWPGQASYQLASLPLGVSGSSGLMMVELLGNSDSSGGLTIWAAAYRLTGSTAGNATIRSGGFTWASGSDTTASSLYGGVSGTRYQSFPWDVNLSAGDYLFGFAISTENDGTARVFGRQGANLVGPGPGVGAETNYFLDGYTNSTIAAFPANIVANNTNLIRTGLSAQRQPAFILFGTV